MYVEMGDNLDPWLTLGLLLRCQPIISVSTSSLSGTGWLERDGGENFPPSCHLHFDDSLEGWALLKDLLQREDPVENRMPRLHIYKTIVPARSKRVFFSLSYLVWAPGSTLSIGFPMTGQSLSCAFLSHYLRYDVFNWKNPDCSLSPIMFWYFP